EFKNSTKTLEIHKWEAANHPSGVNFYATLGRSTRPHGQHEDNHRVEFVIGLRPAVDDIIFPLAALAASSAEMAPGSTFRWHKALWAGTEMNSLLVSRPLEEVVPPLHVDALHIVFDMAIPLFPAECEFVIENGPEALRERWERSKVAFWNPLRGAS